MVLPKNTAAQDAQKDQGLYTKEQITATQEQRDKMWAKVAAAKTPHHYKTLIDEAFKSECLLEQLEADNARTTILSSVRLSPVHYLKLKKIMEAEQVDFKGLLIEMIDGKLRKQV